MDGTAGVFTESWVAGTTDRRRAMARKGTMMDTWGPLLLFAGVLLGWFALQKWILPRFGIAT